MLAYATFKVFIAPAAFDREIEFHVWNLYLRGQEALIVGLAYMFLSLTLILVGLVGDGDENS
ncbi:hypothetical protein [Thiohalomonas denitrificans]|uniref:Uncharacterized protein n=1 Tax=Thiohalomonas denitrificans TaxID=415747 RepID=A0A1G5PRQ8_9GAMM|nr:hypothetical protein [Thiohalomonas denitrificans]SCZ52264.1 hypothetical protein SAMN03097708_00711 [Thiohalomonas denitrificans]